MKKDLIENTPFSPKAIRNHLQLHNQMSVIKPILKSHTARLTLCIQKMTFVDC